MDPAPRSRNLRLALIACRQGKMAVIGIYSRRLCLGDKQISGTTGCYCGGAQLFMLNYGYSMSELIQRLLPTSGESTLHRIRSCET